ncbi:MAG: hypothetical protein IPH30_10465 [Betaproteobacteria bacterium]|nr:hypothetical protein [Betaproteobacteria bacterium]
MALAMDATGGRRLSVPITVTVGPAQPPTVAITTPGNGAAYTAPATIALAANATAAGGATIAKVEYFKGPTLVASATSARTRPRGRTGGRELPAHRQGDRQPHRHGHVLTHCGDGDGGGSHAGDCRRRGSRRLDGKRDHGAGERDHHRSPQLRGDGERDTRHGGHRQPVLGERRALERRGQPDHAHRDHAGRGEREPGDHHQQQREWRLSWSPRRARRDCAAYGDFHGERGIDAGGHHRVRRGRQRDGGCDHAGHSADGGGGDLQFGGDGAAAGYLQGRVRQRDLHGDQAGAHH